MRARAWAGVVAGAIAGATDVLYIIIISRQGESSAVVPWVFLIIALLALAALTGGILAPGRTASLVLGVTASLLFAMGVLGIFSIGLFLFAASMFCLAGVFQSRNRQRSTSGGHPPVGDPSR
ncbi:MAG: hypothetical protein M3P18_17395 [Actinomycetota bacterium]|nr:hypothetical protein [Actinomycetota bacterium]